MAHPAVWDGQIPTHPFETARLVWVEVPKSGSTSVKMALANALLGTAFTDDIGLHDFVGWTHARTQAELAEWLAQRWDGWYRFTVVRHPIDRFESLYYEKIDPAGRGSINAWVAAQADSYWWEDIHAVPQTRIIGDPAAYDCVGRLERLDELATMLSERLAVPLQFGRHNSARRPDREPLTAETRALLARIYAADLEAFEYPLDGLRRGVDFR